MAAVVSNRQSPSCLQDPNASTLTALSGVYRSFVRPAQTHLALTDIRNRRNHTSPGPIGLRFPTTRVLVFNSFYSYRLSLYIQPLSVLPQTSRIFWKVRILVLYGASVVHPLLLYGDLHEHLAIEWLP